MPHVSRSRRWPRCARRLPTRPSHPSPASWPRSRSWSAPTTPLTRSTTAWPPSARSPTPISRSSSSTTARVTTPGPARRSIRRPRRRHSERRPQRRPQPRSRRGDRRHRRLHRRRRARRSGLAHVSRAADAHVVVRRLRRPNVVPPDDPFVAQCVARARRAARPGAARRSRGRARAGLQHGASAATPWPASADSTHLPPRRRRRGRVLAASGQGFQDRLRALGPRVASPPQHGEGLLAAAGGLRRGRDLARRPHPEKFIGGQMLWQGGSTARSRSSARCRAAASTRACGARRRFPAFTAPTSTRCSSCRTPRRGWRSRRCCAWPVCRPGSSSPTRSKRCCCSPRGCSGGARRSYAARSSPPARICRGCPVRKHGGAACGTGRRSRGCTSCSRWRVWPDPRHVVAPPLWRPSTSRARPGRRRCRRSARSAVGAPARRRLGAAHVLE